MRQRKRRFEVFNFYNMTAIVPHLEKMALKGWMLEKIVNTHWVYRRIEPKKLHFAVSYYPKASEFDPEPTEEQKEFLDFCAHTGWHLACTSAQMQIFYNAQEDPIPIETEPELEVEAIAASVKKTLIPSYIVLIILGLIYGWIFLMSLLGNPIATLASTTRIFLGLAGVCLLVLCSGELIAYYRWHSRAEAAAENGIFLPPPDTVNLQKGILAAFFLGAAYYFVDHMMNGDDLRRWILLIMCLYMPLVFFAENAAKEFLKKKKASRGINRTLTFAVGVLCAFLFLQAVAYGTLWANENRLFESDEETYEHNGLTWVIHNDELPLVLEDLVEADPEKYIKERNADESFLVGNFRLRQFVRFDMEDRFDLPELEYRMVLVKLPFLYDTCKNRLIYEGEGPRSRMVYPEPPCTYEPEDPASWGAEEAYRLLNPETGFENKYLLCYEDMLVELEMDWEPTKEQRAIIREKLTGGK